MVIVRTSNLLINCKKITLYASRFFYEFRPTTLAGLNVKENTKTFDETYIEHSQYSFVTEYSFISQKISEISEMQYSQKTIVYEQSLFIVFYYRLI